MFELWLSNQAVLLLLFAERKPHVVALTFAFSLWFQLFACLVGMGHRC